MGKSIGNEHSDRRNADDGRSEPVPEQAATHLCNQSCTDRKADGEDERLGPQRTSQTPRHPAHETADERSVGQDQRGPEHGAPNGRCVLPDICAVERCRSDESDEQQRERSGRPGSALEHPGTDCRQHDSRDRDSDCCARAEGPGQCRGPAHERDRRRLIEPAPDCLGVDERMHLSTRIQLAGPIPEVVVTSAIFHGCCYRSSPAPRVRTGKGPAIARGKHDELHDDDEGNRRSQQPQVGVGLDVRTAVHPCPRPPRRQRTRGRRESREA